MKVLTDTHTLVWALTNPEALGSGAYAALQNASVAASVVNLWELVLKSRKPGAMLGDPIPWWEKYVVRSGIPALSIRISHVRALASLPELHKDPFDRMLVAQSLVEGLTLVTKDEALARYGVPVIW